MLLKLNFHRLSRTAEAGQHQPVTVCGQLHKVIHKDIRKSYLYELESPMFIKEYTLLSSANSFIILEIPARTFGEGRQTHTN